MLEVLHTIFGFILLLAPFLLVFLYKDRTKGFICICIFVAVFHLMVALATQWTGMFSYGFIVSIHTIIAVLCAGYFLVNRKKILYPKIYFNWFVVLMFIISALFLFSIHFYYTGIVDTGFAELKSVSGSSYLYPFYSDEWIAIAFMEHSINTQSLPFINPLHEAAPHFINFTVGFYAVLAEIALLLHVAPLTSYVFFAILNGLFISFFIYQILRSLHVGQSISSIAAISVFFITHSGNLPGIWNLLPYSLSLTFFLASIFGVIRNDKVIFFIASGISFILYPPIGLFIAPVFYAYLLLYQKTKKVFFTGTTLLQICGIFVLPVFIIIVLGINIFTFDDLFQKIQSLIFRENLEGGITSFAIWKVVPLFSLPFILFGLVSIIHKKITPILFPVSVGLLFWIMYSFLQSVFVIEAARVVVITSTLLMIVFGIGLNTIIKYNFFTRHISVSDSFVLNSLKIITIIFFITFAVFHTHFWMGNKLVLSINKGKHIHKFVPAPPVTRYLHNEDLRIFKNIKGKKFISSPWKGLVVGVATGNYPLDSKASTISNNTLTLAEFFKGDCSEKKKNAKKYNIDYVYSPSFVCEGFELLDRSTEGLFLYKNVNK